MSSSFSAAASMAMIATAAAAAGSLSIAECDGTFCFGKCNNVSPPLNTCISDGKGAWIQFTCETQTENSCGSLYASVTDKPAPACGPARVGESSEVCNQCKPYLRKTDGQVRYSMTTCDAKQPKSNPRVIYDCTDAKCSQGCASTPATIPLDGSCFSSNETRPLVFQWAETFACPTVCKYSAFKDFECKTAVFSTDVPNDACVADFAEKKSYRYTYTQ